LEEELNPRSVMRGGHVIPIKKKSAGARKSNINETLRKMGGERQRKD